MKARGFISLLIAIIIGLVLLGGGAYYYYKIAPTSTPQTATTTPSQSAAQVSFKITAVQGNNITVSYTGLSDVAEYGPTPLRYIQVRTTASDSRQILLVDAKGPSGSVSITVPAATPEGDYWILPLGVPTNTYTPDGLRIDYIGPGVGYGSIGHFVEAYFTYAKGAITPLSAAPIKSFVVSPLSGPASLMVTFDFPASAGNVNIDFGDGTSVTTSCPGGSSDGPECAYPHGTNASGGLHTVHTYTKPGTYTATGSRLMPSTVLGSAVITVK